MVEVGPFAAASYDILRLLVVPAFVMAAWWDVRTRRVTNRLWPPLVALALVALAIEGWTAASAGGSVWQEFLLVTSLSIGLLVPLAYGLYHIGGFGGADAKAIMVLAVVFPTVPGYELATWVFPAAEPTAGVFSLSILTNAVLVGLLFPIGLAARNVAAGDVGLTMFIGRRIHPSEAEALPGRLIETPSGFDRQGLDLDALRMYLRWRRCTLDDLRNEPERFRSTGPRDPGDPGDGAVADGGTRDPWAAAAFLDDVPGGAYGTTPTSLRQGLEVLVDNEPVWYSPGIPFILLLAAGLVVAIVYGDLLVSAMASVGMV